jgi:hypothetical protein
MYVYQCTDVLVLVEVTHTGQGPLQINNSVDSLPIVTGEAYVMELIG